LVHEKYVALYRESGIVWAIHRKFREKKKKFGQNCRIEIPNFGFVKYKWKTE